MPPPGTLTYQEVYPSDPLLRSRDLVRPRASELIHLEFFEAEPARMPTGRFAQHHILLNLREAPHRVENWREGAHRDFLYAPGEIIITPAGMASGWYWHERSRVIVITIAPPELERFAERELGMVLGARQLMDVPQAHDPDLVSAGTLLMEALKTRGTGSEVMYESLARVFTVKLLQRYGEDQAAEARFSRAFTPRHYKRVLDLVAERFAGAVTTGEMARAAGLSEAHFSRQFRKTIGDSPHQFLMRYRTERAAGMLGDAQRPLSDIAAACGFADQAHFTRLFKRFTGLTPRQYRARA